MSQDYVGMMHVNTETCPLSLIYVVWPITKEINHTRNAIGMHKEDYIANDELVLPNQKAVIGCTHSLTHSLTHYICVQSACRSITVCHAHQ
jgi:hypothetical protein